MHRLFITMYEVLCLIQLVVLLVQGDELCEV